MKTLPNIVNDHIDLLEPVRHEIGLMAVLIAQSDFSQAQGLGYNLTRWADILDQASDELLMASRRVRDQEPTPLTLDLTTDEVIQLRSLAEQTGEEPGDLAQRLLSEAIAASAAEISGGAA